MSLPLTADLIISAVTLGVNPVLSAALTTAEQVLNSLLFGDLHNFVTSKRLVDLIHF